MSPNRTLDNLFHSHFLSMPQKFTLTVNSNISLSKPEENYKIK